jgi:putative hydrolase of the HAD superfamily
MSILHQIPSPDQVDVLLFDLGGVIINIDYTLTKKAFEQLGVSEFDRLFSKAKQNQLFDQLEKGQISDLEFYRQIRAVSNMQLENEAIKNAWNAILLDIPEKRIQLLQQLSKKFRLFLISNTNSIHIEAFTRQLINQFGKNPFPEIFEKVYYSSEIGKRKPDTDIFNFVILQNNLVKERCLFIDDSPQHIEGAARCGIPAFHLLDGVDILDLFKNNAMIADRKIK